jgi:hypothetical protein
LCPLNDVAPLPNIIGVPKEMMLPRTRSSCIYFCAEANNLSTSPYHKQVLTGTDSHVESLVFIDSLFTPSDEDIKGVVNCVQQCINMMIWPLNSVSSTTIDVTPAVPNRKRTSDLTTTVLTVTSNKGPLLNQPTNPGAAIGGAIGGLLALLALIGLIVVGLAIKHSYKQKNESLSPRYVRRFNDGV